ncbi:uncharacterized protein CXorf58 homolog [Nycticebus coucang]|uniref:uncharacterized protein CXorf58 homolog n=1 Tax=Nycticebus coucang TaxID=9470 RepID=UPI00234CE1C4|nr:uncharacterized protein CXorf58 homolog [Nycticebus coucang]
MSLATVAPAGSPRSRPRPPQKGGYGGPEGPLFLRLQAAAVRETAATGKRPFSRGGAWEPRGGRHSALRWEPFSQRGLGAQRRELGALSPESTGRGRSANLGRLRQPRSGKAQIGDYFIVKKMNRFLNRPSTAITQLGNELFGKERKVYLAKDAKARLKQRRRRDTSARTIQRAWLAHANRALFKLLKHTVCAAEYYVTYEIMKKVSPVEANLLKDPSMKYKVRFRFSGETFPPFIVFKIFLHNEGRGYKYFSGKKSLKSSNKAVVDAYKIMGKKEFCHQVIEDECIFQKFGVTEEIDIVTMQDFMQYSSLLDETPASSGGRNNYWRKLNLEDIPRTMIMYDIIDYAESRVVSNRLRKEMKYLLQRPGTEEMRQRQLQIVSEIRYPPFSTTQTLYRPSRQQSQIKHLGRRSKKAQMKVEKMKKAYLAKGKNASMMTERKMDTADAKQQRMVIFSTPSFDIVKIDEPASDSELEKEKKEKKDLFTWSQDICIGTSLPY